MSDANLRSLFRFDGIITTLSGLLMMAVPQLLINLLQLGDTTVMWVRGLGIVWLVFGLWLLTLWNANYTKGTAEFSAVFLAINADILILAALFGNLNLGILGWIAMLGTAGFICFIAYMWWRVRGQILEAAPAI